MIEWSVGWVPYARMVFYGQSINWQISPALTCHIWKTFWYFKVWQFLNGCFGTAKFRNSRVIKGLEFQGLSDIHSSTYKSRNLLFDKFCRVWPYFSLNHLCLLLNFIIEYNFLLCLEKDVFFCLNSIRGITPFMVS